MDGYDFNSNDKNNIYIIFLGYIFIFSISLLFDFNKSTTDFVILFSFATIVIYFVLNYKKENVLNNFEYSSYKLNTIQKLVYDWVDMKLKRIAQSNNPGQIKLLSKTDFSDLYNKSYLDSLYIDSKMIDFLYLNKYLNEKNPEVYYNVCVSTNTFLKYINEIIIMDKEGNDLPNNTQEIIQEAILKYIEANTNLNSFIFTIEPTNFSNGELDKVVKNYNKLVLYQINYLKEINKKFIKKYGINTRTKMNLFYEINHLIKGESPLFELF